MEKNDLIKKLENTERPEIEIKSHKENLRRALVNEFFKAKKPIGVFDIFKKTLIPIGAGVLIIIAVLIFTNLFLPQSTALAKAKEIALQHPQIKELVTRGGEIKDIKIIENRAYVLVSPPEIKRPFMEKKSKAPLKAEKKETIEAEQIDIETVEPVSLLAEIELDQKKVSKIERIKPSVIPLTKNDKEKIHKIIHTPEVLKLGEPAVKSIKAVPSFPHKLIKKGKRVEILHEKKASVIYEVAENQWEGEVNLKEETIEVRPLEEIRE